jgi:hypothetical protein
MGITFYILFILIILIVLDAAALIHAIKHKKWFAFVTITAIILLFIFSIAYLWITSPM